MWECYTCARPYSDVPEDQIAQRVTLKGLRPTFPPDTPRAYGWVPCRGGRQARFAPSLEQRAVRRAVAPEWASRLPDCAMWPRGRINTRLAPSLRFCPY